MGFIPPVNCLPGSPRYFIGTLATVLVDEAVVQASISWRQAGRCSSAAHPAKLNQRLRGSAAHSAKPNPQTTHAEAPPTNHPRRSSSPTQRRAQKPYEGARGSPITANQRPYRCLGSILSALQTPSQSPQEPLTSCILNTFARRPHISSDHVLDRNPCAQVKGPVSFSVYC